MVFIREVDNLRGLIGGLMEGISNLRLDAIGGVTSLSTRISRLNVCAQGLQQLSTVDDINAYCLTAAQGMGEDVVSKLAECESRISTLAQIVAN